jgi:hypothetical protein
VNDIKSIQLILDDLYANESWNEEKIMIYELQLIHLVKSTNEQKNN